MAESNHRGAYFSGLCDNLMYFGPNTQCMRAGLVVSSLSDNFSFELTGKHNSLSISNNSDPLLEHFHYLASLVIAEDNLHHLGSDELSPHFFLVDQSLLSLIFAFFPPCQKTVI